jgi:tetratricopeptide (TPR) repeat protein
MQCALHPDREAVGHCAACLKTVCVLCMSPLILDVTCKSCAAPILAAQKQRARLGKVVAVVVVGLMVAAGAWAFQNYEPPSDQVVTRYEPAPPDPVELEKQQHAAELVEFEKREPALELVEVEKQEPAPKPVKRQNHEPAPDWGKYSGKIRSLIAALKTYPCDRTKALELSQQLLRAGDNRGVLTHDEAFFAACGDMPRLRWDMYEAHKNLSEWDLAIAEATKLIEYDRTDPDYWWWRGRAHANKGDLEAAVANFRQSVELCPRCTGAWDLADALEKLGRPCEAIPPLQTMLALSKQHLDERRVEARIADLTARGDCVSEIGQGRAHTP